MKKSTAILLIFLFLTGCNNQNIQKLPQIMDNMQNSTYSNTHKMDIDNYEQPDEQPDGQNEVYDFWIRANDSIDISQMNLYKQTKNVRFVDEENASISLYIKAAIDEHGEFMFDTQNETILFMETSFGDFQLFPSEIVPEYMHQSGVEYMAFNDLNNKKNIYGDLNVMVTVRHTAGYKIYNCVFDSDERAFKVIPIFYIENINRAY